MPHELIIRRRWPGFGICQIRIATLGPSVPRSTRLFACLSRSISRLGLASLRFTVDPKWLVRERSPSGGPMVSYFLRIHRKALAQEFYLRHRRLPGPPVARGNSPDPPLATLVPLDSRIEFQRPERSKLGEICPLPSNTKTALASECSANAISQGTLPWAEALLMSHWLGHQVAAPSTVTVWKLESGLSPIPSCPEIAWPLIPNLATADEAGLCPAPEPL